MTLDELKELEDKYTARMSDLHDQIEELQAEWLWTKRKKEGLLDVAEAYAAIEKFESELKSRS